MKLNFQFFKKTSSKLFPSNLVKRKAKYSGIILKSFLVLAILHFTFCIINFTGCSSTSTIEEKAAPKKVLDESLTNDIAYSQSSDLTFNIPKGWFTSEDNDCKCIDLWLIRDDFSATLNLTTLELENIPKDKDDILDSLLQKSKCEKKKKIMETFKILEEDKFFTVNEREFASYQYEGNEKMPIQVIVFEFENRFFELSALPAANVGRGKVIPEELFKVQKAVLTSIKE